MPKIKESAATKLYKRYAYLADIYANKLYNTNAIGMDRDDVLQELRYKIFTSIKSYGIRWREYRKKGLFKPVPLRYYIQTAMNNKLIDMVDQIQKDINQYSLSIEDNSFDYGVDTNNGMTSLKLSGDKKEVLIGGINLLTGLQGKQKDVFCMYLKGHTIKTIEKVYKNQVPDISSVIRSRVELLQKHKNELYSETKPVHYSYSLAEED